MRSGSPNGSVRRPPGRCICWACSSTTPTPPTTCRRRESLLSIRPTGWPGSTRSRAVRSSSPPMGCRPRSSGVPPSSVSMRSTPHAPTWCARTSSSPTSPARGTRSFTSVAKDTPNPKVSSGKVHLVQDASDIDALDLRGDRIAVTCQTTLSVWDTEDLINRVRSRYPRAEVHNEICRATQERQEAAVEAAKDVDVVIVVGSSRSSNSLRLVEVVKKLGRKPAYLVDRLEDLDVAWLKGAKRVGVTSGASTPSQLTRRVIEYIEALEPPA